MLGNCETTPTRLNAAVNTMAWRESPRAELVEDVLLRSRDMSSVSALEERLCCFTEIIKR